MKSTWVREGSFKQVLGTLAQRTLEINLGKLDLLYVTTVIAVPAVMLHQWFLASNTKQKQKT